MTLWSLLLAPYSFSKMLDSVSAALGPNMLYFAIAFFALAAFFVLAPSTGTFSGMDIRMAGLYLASNALNLAVVFLLIASWQQALWTIAYLLPLILLGFWASRMVAKGFTHADITRMKYSPRIEEAFELGKRYLPLALLAVGIPGEVFLLDHYNPSLPFLSWVLLFYEFALSVFTAALMLGTIFQVSVATPTRVRLDNGEVLEGLTIGRAADHINLLTPDANLFVQTSHIITMGSIPPPQRRQQG
jgi:hypothetical protein